MSQLSVYNGNQLAYYAGLDKLAIDENCCECEEGIPTEPDCGDCYIGYYIVGYNDTFFTPCSSCYIDIANSPWPGRFRNSVEPPPGAPPGSGPCTWVAWPGALHRINGKSLHMTQTFIRLRAVPGWHWQLQVACAELTPQVIWYGEKWTGLCPDGVYAGEGICESGPSSVTVAGPIPDP